METNRNTKFPIPKNELYYWDDAEKALKPLIGSDGALGIKSAGEVMVGVTSSDIMQPVDIQSHYQQTIQTHSGVMIAPKGTNRSSVIDTNGFDSIAVTLKNSSSGTSHVEIVWSHDGVNPHGSEVPISSSSTTSLKSGVAETKARYCHLVVYNTDEVSAKTMDVFAYLKA